ncbi:MAG: hypothetical protein KR126chlam3_01505 [Chlamydiae bacterium]|nr:hypothetical protein [Chlamydiota bacterium]
MTSLSVSSGIEHSCWYIDWTSWDTPVPEGVDMVNIFVGKIDLDNGNPTMGGFGNITPEKLDTFVKDCAAKNVKVKVSIGGAGGMYDNCWDVLNEGNTQAFAQMMVAFCQQHNLAGVDFDYEELKSPEQEALVGQLIKEFRTLDPNLEASLCTNAGFDAWKGGVQTILDATSNNGKSLLSRLYIMSYYDPLDQEEGFIAQWADWVKSSYGFTASQVTVGLDDFDANAYDIGEFAKWAGTNGFSTGYWAWNPATPDQSNASALKVLNSYKPLAQKAALASSRISKTDDLNNLETIVRRFESLAPKTIPVLRRIASTVSAAFKKVSSKFCCCCVPVE